MEIKTLTCPNCGGNLNSDNKFCPYCGSSIIITDDNTVNINYTARNIDDAKIAKEKYKAEYKLKKMEQEEREQKRNLLIGVAFIIFSIFMIILPRIL